MRVFVLDDDERRQREFVHRHIGDVIVQARTADEAVEKLLTEEPFDVVQLDHDLGGEVYCPSDHKSGYAVAFALAEMAGAKRHGRIIVHSYNRRGAAEMCRVLIEKGLCVEYRPFGVWA